MAANAAPMSPPRSKDTLGVIFVIIGMWFFVGQDVLMKDLLSSQPLWLLIFARACVSVVILVPLITAIGGRHRLCTPLWPIHLVRAFLFTGGFAMFYAAFPFMGLAEVSTIFFSAPLFTAILGAAFLGETVGRHRIAALIIGFIGVLIAMAPGHSGFGWVALLPLICAVFYAISMVLTRKVGDSESSLTMSLWTIVFSGLLIWPMGWLVNSLIEVGPEFAHLRLEFLVPQGAERVQLALIGVVGMTGYILLNRAYQVASTSLIAPFDYTYLPFATVVAWLLWDEVPGPQTIAGMALIIGSGLYLGYRELLAANRAEAPAPVGETVFTTGTPVPGEDRG